MDDRNAHTQGFALPTGTVTFLFTDIEGSTGRWEAHPTAMKAALDQHDALLRAAITAQAGRVFQSAGDSLVAAFASPGPALAAALAGQRALLAAQWPAALGAIRVRMALHTGPAELRDGAYHAEFTLNRLARLLAAGHGGQILSSDTTRVLLNGGSPRHVAWQDLGEHWLKDLIRPVHVYQAQAPDLPREFPPLKTLDAPPLVVGAPAPEGADVENPYKGLRAFREADSADFFGREALAERLVARLGEAVPLARFLAVVGPSGSGKSSVVRAGVLPALRGGGLPGSERWLIVEMIPGPDPVGELAAALSAASGQDPARVRATLAADELGLLRTAQQLLPALRQSALLLVIDQFEEVFTLVTDEPARVHFLETLHRAVTAPASPVRVLVTLRADFYDRPLLYPDPGELLRQRTEVVLPLTAEELARAISNPAGRAGVTVEAPLVGAMIQDVAEQPGTLPLLEYALTELFDHRAGARLTLAAYRASGGVQGALGRRADETYGALGAPAQEVARQVFLRLVTLGEGAEDTRRRVRRAELAGLPVEADMVVASWSSSAATGC
jgi:class 3 adenylate cyclase